jgi:hypothetical protein
MKFRWWENILPLLFLQVTQRQTIAVIIWFPFFELILHNHGCQKKAKTGNINEYSFQVPERGGQHIGIKMVQSACIQEIHKKHAKPRTRRSL